MSTTAQERLRRAGLVLTRDEASGWWRVEHKDFPSAGQRMRGVSEHPRACVRGPVTRPRPTGSDEVGSAGGSLPPNPGTLSRLPLGEA